MYGSVWEREREREREEWISQLLLGFQFFDRYDDSDTNEMIGLSHSCLNFESTNWIFGNKKRIYQLLTKHWAKKRLVITEHYSFDTDLHHAASRILDPTDVIFLTLDLLEDHQWPSSSFFAACGLSWHSNSRIRLHDSFFFFFYDVLFTFLIFIFKSEDLSFSFTCFTKIKRSLKATIFFRRLTSSYMYI